MAGSIQNRFSRQCRVALLCGLGFFTIIVQVVLFRLYLAVFEGNELSISAFFTSWLAWVSVGAALTRIRPAKSSGLLERFDILPLIYLPAFLLQYWLISQSRSMLGIEHYEQFPIAQMILLTALTNAPVSICTGFLFSLACAWNSGKHSVAEVYSWEAGGSLLGGLSVTLMFHHCYSPGTVMLWTSLLLAIASLAASFRKRRALLPAAVFALLLVAKISGTDDLLESRNRLSRWERIAPAGYLGSFRTPQADYVYGRHRDQINVLAWDSVTETIPNAEKAGEIIASILPHHPEAERFLVIGPNAFTLCSLLSDLPRTVAVTWVHPDPWYTRKLLGILEDESPASIRRVSTPHKDPLTCISQAKHEYDVIINCLPDATTLSLNRYTTVEALRKTREALRKSGIFAVRVTGSENHLGDEMLNAGATMFATVSDVFANIAIRPGDETWLIASDDRSLDGSPQELRDRFASIPGAAAIYPPEAFLSMYLPGRAESQLNQYRRASEALPSSLLLNTDKRPRSLLNNMILLLRQAGTPTTLTRSLRTIAARGLFLFPLALFIFVITRLVYLIRIPGNTSSIPRFDDSFLMLSTGAAGMTSSIILILAYQYRHGTVFLDIGLISAAFMGGILLGSCIIRFLQVAKRAFTRPALAGAIVLHASLLAALAITDVSFPKPVFIAILACAGFLSGTYFPLLADRLKNLGMDNRASGSFLEATDHFGGSLGGLLFGLFCIPMFGIQTSSLFISILLIANLPPLLIKRRSSRKVARATSTIGYIAFAVAAFALSCSIILQPATTEIEVQVEGPPATDQAERIEKSATINNKDCRYYEYQDENGRPVSYVFKNNDVMRPIRGYSGPMILQIRLSAAGTLEDFAVIRSGDSPMYLNRAVTGVKKMAGADLLDPESFKQCDGVTGATISCAAILKNISHAGKLFASHVITDRDVCIQKEPSRIPWTDTVLIISALAIILYMRRRPKRLPRYVFLGIVVLSFGVWRALQLALPHAFSLLSLNIPSMQSGTAFIAVIVIPIVISCFGNIYCGWLCPFGALQELIGLATPPKIRITPDKTALRFGRTVKYFLLFAAVLLFALTRNYGIPANDQLTALFGKAATRQWSWILAYCLMASVLYHRFWCRNLCPVGAFLSLLNRIRALRFMIPGIAPAHCDLGVESKDQLDCICCDRCRSQPITKVNPERNSHLSPALRNSIFFAAVLGGAIAMLLSLTSPLRKPGQDISSSRENNMDMSLPTTGSWHSRDADIKTITEKIKRKRLSDHEAMYYSRESD